MVSLRRQHSWLERYDVSQMRFYEFYAMGVPIFLPAPAVNLDDDLAAQLLALDFWRMSVSVKPHLHGDLQEL